MIKQTNMTTSIRTSLIVIFIGIFSFASVTASATKPGGDEKKKKDVVVDIKATVLQNTAYFNLRMQNESETAMYMLLRKTFDEQLQVIATKDGVPNTLNQPLLYSFKVDKLDETNAEYVLVKVGKDYEELKSWNFNPTAGLTEIR